MNPNHFFASAAILSLLLLPACSVPSEPVAVTVTCDDFARARSSTTPTASIDKEVTVAVGALLTVTLCSNPATGFQWEQPRIADVSVVDLVDHQVTPAPPDRVGAPGAETWTFKAVKQGTSTIALAYSRPWSGGEQGAWQFNLRVTAG